MCCELSLCDNLILAVTQQLINYYARYGMYTYPLISIWLFVYIFIMQLVKITLKLYTTRT